MCLCGRVHGTEGHPAIWLGPSVGCTDVSGVNALILLVPLLHDLGQAIFLTFFFGFYEVFPPDRTTMCCHFLSLSGYFLETSPTCANLLLKNDICLGKFISYNINSKGEGLLFPYSSSTWYIARLY